MTRKTDAWMPMFIGDYRKDTARLSCEQHGAYLQLLFDYWVAGPPPDDDATLARIVGLELKAWKRHRPVLQRYFTVENGEWRHKRVDQELAGAAERSGKAAAKAKAAADARWERERDKHPTADALSNAPSMPEGLPEQCPADAIHLSPVTLPAEEGSSAGAAKRGSRLPTDWSPDPEDVAYAVGEGFTEREARRIGEIFRDYWSARSGKDATKLDWHATWRNWIRGEWDRRGRRADQPKQRVGFV